LFFDCQKKLFLLRQQKKVSFNILSFFVCLFFSQRFFSETPKTIPLVKPKRLVGLSVGTGEPPFFLSFVKKQGVSLSKKAANGAAILLYRG
jgi:hypothetical protein